MKASDVPVATRTLSRLCRLDSGLLSFFALSKNQQLTGSFRDENKRHVGGDDRAEQRRIGTSYVNLSRMCGRGRGDFVYMIKR
jgi:hypothetical protein